MKYLPLLFLFLGTFGCRTLTNDSFAPSSTILYKSAENAQLKLHVFRPRPSAMTEPRPAIVFFFGGGWKSGKPQQFYPQCAYLASRGMVAISAEYRVKEQHGTTPRECVEDGKSAVRWIRQHASALGVDPDRLAAGGGSAGGHVAAITGMTDVFNAADEDASVSSRPNALVLFNPVIDTEPRTPQRDWIKDYWREISPLHNVDETTPPMVFFLGAEDDVISVPLAQEFQRRLESKGRRCDLHVYAGQEHGFFNYHRSHEYFVKTMTETDLFLQSLGYLPKLPEVNVADWIQRNR